MDQDHLNITAMLTFVFAEILQQFIYTILENHLIVILLNTVMMMISARMKTRSSFSQL